MSINRQTLDLTNGIEVKRKVNEIKPDTVINAAAKVGGKQDNINYPGKYLEENLNIQLNVFSALKSTKVAKIINFSSIYMYPGEQVSPVREENILDGKFNQDYESYALAKIVGVKLLENLYKEFGILSTTLVLPNVYGENDSLVAGKARLIPSAFLKLASNEKVSFYGDGTQVREFIESRDVASAVEFFMNTEENEGVVNIGNDEHFEIREVVEKIQVMMGSKSKVSWSGYNEIHAEKIFKVDKTKMKKLGWQPGISLEEGLVYFYDWFKKNCEAN